MSGTSMAAPHVGGVVSLLFSAEPTLTVEEISQGLYAGATQTVNRGEDAIPDCNHQR